MSDTALRTPEVDDIPVVSPANNPAAPPLPRQGFIQLSPLNRRRWLNFKANRRGFWSLWLFLALFGTCVFAELIANDRPIVASYKGEILYPAFIDYPEEKFGGFLAVTDYRDQVVAKEIEQHGWMAWPPMRAGQHHLQRPACRMRPERTEWVAITTVA